MRWGSLLTLALALALADSTAAAPPGLQGFIRVSNGSFVDEQCHEYLPFGWNRQETPWSTPWTVWVNLNEEAANAASSLTDGESALDPSVQNNVVSLFQEANTCGFNVIRLFALGQDVNHQLQLAPGRYNESYFRGIDFLLAVAGMHSVKAIVNTLDNWLDPEVGGGKNQYLAWAGIDPEYEDTFWTSKKVRDMIKDHYTVLVNRRNVFTGKLYKDDDTILAWDIYNEPRCPASQIGTGCPSAITAFYRDLSAYMKHVDPNHLVTTGEEGFFELSSGEADADPSGIPENVLSAGRYWSAKIGQDFQAQCDLPSIDYCTIHMWPDNWESTDPMFPHTWIEAHEAVSAAMGKPLVLEEFGKGKGKNVTYAAVYDTLQDSSLHNGSFKGVLFWRWGQDSVEGGGTDFNIVQTGDPTFQLILNASAHIKPFLGRSVPGCNPKPPVTAFG
ncbi:Mannan endo-1,4-beta-mannosidase 1 [Coccomyxa sp. Obi]|nr:Mannan endo-1,4-beta-mannosidase 1 [Coccomyxa sp. Obi]